MGPRSLRLTVAHNGDERLVPRLRGLASVESVFGKMSSDLVGGGRNSFILADVDFGMTKQLIEQAHTLDLKFLYLLNAACLSNMETTRRYNDRLFNFIGALVDAGVDGFVIAVPYLLELIKHHFPAVKVSVSTFAIVNSITKAKIWEQKGADRIILQQDINRDFKLLRKIRKAVSCELELFANNMCQNQCPYPPFHAAFNSHSSTTRDVNRGFVLDYCGFNCSKRRLENPVEFVRGRFIRPEDLHLYEDIGIDIFKLSDRVRPTNWIVNTVAAYDARRYDGNLADIISYPYIRGEDDTLLSDIASFLLRPDLVMTDVLKDISAMGAIQGMVHVDNRRLDGFCEHFAKHDCKNTICDEECWHCATYAEQSVTLNKKASEDKIEHNRRILERLVDRSAFHTEPLLKRASIRTMMAT